MYRLFGIHASFDTHLSQIEQFATVQLWFSIQHHLDFIHQFKRGKNDVHGVLYFEIIHLSFGWHFHGLTVRPMRMILAHCVFFSLIFNVCAPNCTLMMVAIVSSAIIEKVQTSQQLDSYWTSQITFGQFVDNLKVNFLANDSSSKQLCVLQARMHATT